MAKIASWGERVREGEAALARGAWTEARAIFEQELEARETIEALEGLSWATWWVEDVSACLEARERAFRLSRRQGDLRRAAMLALWSVTITSFCAANADRQRLVPARGPHPRGARALPRARLARRAFGIRGHRRRRLGESEGARDPGAQPGLALLRLAQGKGDAAAAAIRRTVDETADPLKRVELLPAHVEIMLAVGDLEEARRASDELDAISEAQANDPVSATAAHAGGAVALAHGDARGALTRLREALGTWQGLEAPYEAARTRVLIGLACGQMGDDDTAALELEAARSVFEDLGAATDLSRVRSLMAPAASKETHGLTARELQVLRLLADGKTNRAIATELVLSVRTVDRHVGNIFVKLGVSTRAAATAFAYEHQLL